MRDLLRALEESKQSVQDGLTEKMERKPQLIDDALMIYNSDLSDEEKQFVGKLPIFAAQDLWGARTNERDIGSKFSKSNVPRWFIVELMVLELRRERRRVLVDTEGYDYVRYGAQLEK